MKKQTKTQPRRNNPVINKGVKAAAVIALAPLALTGCPNPTVEYRDVIKEVETSHESVFKDADNNDTVYLSFTDTAYRIVKDKPGQLDQFNDYISDITRVNANYIDYFKNKTRLDVLITDFTDNGVICYAIGTDALVINVRHFVNNNDIADNLISECASGISSLSDYTPPSSSMKKANDSNIRMAGMGPMPHKGELWRQLEQAKSRNARQIAANSRYHA
jgi:hypothetical protein